MKASGQAARAFCSCPDPEFQVVLLTGPDGGAVSEAASDLICAWSGGHPPDPDRLTILGENDLADCDRLVDALLGPGLFGSGTPVVRLIIDSQRRVPMILRILNDIASGRLIPSAKWLIEAPGELKASSALRRAFETADSAICLVLPADSHADTAALLCAQLQRDQITIESGAVDFLAAAFGTNRRMMRAEIEKLALYGRFLKRPLTMTDVDAIVCADQTGDARNAAFASVSGRFDQADQAAERFISAGGAPISALRSLHFAVVFAFRRGKSISSRKLASAIKLLWTHEKLAKSVPFPALAAYRIALRGIACGSEHIDNKANRPPRQS